MVENHFLTEDNNQSDKLILIVVIVTIAYLNGNKKRLSKNFQVDTSLIQKDF